jgi:hypothetical protein
MFSSIGAIAANRRRLWMPNRLGASLAMWLDAADTNTVILNGSNVSRWDDKSGNGRNAVQNTAANQPIYTLAGQNGRSVLTFDGSDDFMDVVTTVFQGIGNFQLHWIYARLGAGTGGDTYRPAISSLSATTPPPDRGALHYIKNSNNLGASYPFFSVSPSWGNYDLTTGTVYSNNQANLLSLNAGASSWNVFRNGTQEGAGSRGGSPGIDYNGLRLAQQANPLRRSNIYIAEIVMTLDADTFNRQLLEGYLAHKWGLAANLPADHPFRIVPPTV